MMKRIPRSVCSLFMLMLSFCAMSQEQYELKDGWKCASLSETKADGIAISSLGYSLSGWLPAVVPGTVLTTLLENKLVPDPFYGMNNEKIPDIYQTGRDHYTYWFVKDFKEKPPGDEQVWLHLRGVNYSCEVYLNGHKVNVHTHYGMFLRQSYNITRLLSGDGNNRLAIIVYPVDPVGNPNGGQGGDGTIARNVSHQYVAGWDWIQPIRDRNTGIWDKVFIEKTRSVRLKDPHIITLVPGKRKPDGKQEPAIIKISAILENTNNNSVTGVLRYQLEGHTISQQVSIGPNATEEIRLPDLVLNNPKLWWPNGYGAQYLYHTKLQFLINGYFLSDEENLSFGAREIQTSWNEVTRSKQIFVNGQPIFIKGGNWIISDAMLRFSEQRYDAEIRYHRDMNLNLIRIWGGAITERPEFYQACDKYGLLVMQDFWGSGDCNGRWIDPMKKDDQWTRRKYPDDHDLFLRSAADQVKMIRNHPSLAIWCGGNEITPPEDIFKALKDSILPALDGTRWFIDYSNSDSMSYNFLGGNGDGPYNIQPISRFWEHRTFPFNSEIGSVGVGDYESLERFIPKENMQVPQEASHNVDSVWHYHKYIGYGQYPQAYGEPADVKDFARKAQLLNYDQYRGLIEGFTAHAWEWYTGVIIWKTQNPWTALRGQMYDYYLDPNACLYGLRSGSEALHVMYNPADGMVMIANNGFDSRRSMMLVIKSYDLDGKEKLLTQVFTGVEACSVKKILPLKESVDQLRKTQGLFLSLQLLNENKQVLSDNFYWLPDSAGKYSGLMQMAPPALQAGAKKLDKTKIELTLSNKAESPVAFFNRIALVDPGTKKRILPSFYSDNYVSVPPGTTKKIIAELPETYAGKTPLITIDGWNLKEQLQIPVGN